MRNKDIGVELHRFQCMCNIISKIFNNARRITMLEIYKVTTEITFLYGFECWDSTEELNEKTRKPINWGF